MERWNLFFNNSQYVDNRIYLFLSNTLLLMTSTLNIDLKIKKKTLSDTESHQDSKNRKKYTGSYLKKKVDDAFQMNETFNR